MFGFFGSNGIKFRILKTIGILNAVSEINK